MRLLGNAANGVTTLSLTNGIMRIASSVTANVWICPLPF